MTKLGLVSDVHYYSPLLGTSGSAYRFREATDQKCLKESPAAFAAVCGELAKSGAHAAVIPGDITNNGERPSHEEAIALLEGLAKTLPVIVTTATHDWSSDGRSKKYEGDEAVPFYDVIGREELPSLYAGFGRELLVSEFKTSIGQISKSYAVNGEVLVIAVNDDCDGEGGKSGYSPAHLDWALGQVEYAKENGLYPVLFEHHLIIDNVSPLVNKGQRIADGCGVAERLADAGLRLAVTGHSHIQRTSCRTSPAGNTLTQLNLGAICGFPGFITYLTINDGKAEITLEPYDFIYEGQVCGADYLKKQTLSLLTSVVGAAATDTKTFAGILKANGIPSSWVKPAAPLVKAVAGKLGRITVKKAAKKINRLAMKKIIPETLYAGIADEKLMPFIEDTFLCMFWDGYARKTNAEFRQVVRAAARLPETLTDRLILSAKKRAEMTKLCAQIREMAENLTDTEKTADTVELI